MHVRQGHEGGQLLQEFQRGEPNPRRPVRPRVGERVDQIAGGICLEALQLYSPTGRIADELFQLIPPMCRNRRLRVEGKPMYTGAARPRKPRGLALVAKACANAAHVLAGPVPESDALLD